MDSRHTFTHQMDNDKNNFMICCLWLDRWEKASKTDHRSIDEFSVQNVVILDVFKFVSFLNLQFLLQYPRKVSVINANVRNWSTQQGKIK